MAGARVIDTCLYLTCIGMALGWGLLAIRDVLAGVGWGMAGRGLDKNGESCL